MCWLQACLAERWDLMFFTGGSYVGKMVAEAAAKNLTPTILELGGKSPAIVDKRVDIEVSAKRLAWASFTNSGQTCVRPDHLFVHEDVADKFLERHGGHSEWRYEDWNDGQSTHAEVGTFSPNPFASPLK